MAASKPPPDFRAVRPGLTYKQYAGQSFAGLRGMSEEELKREYEQYVKYYSC